MAFYIRKFRSRLFLGALFVSQLFILGACNGAKRNLSSKSDGQIVYQKYCVSCHGKKGDRGAGNAADLSTSTISKDSIRKVILYGNDKGMGAYKSIIKNDTIIKHLVEHVKTLQKN